MAFKHLLFIFQPYYQGLLHLYDFGNKYFRIQGIITSSAHSYHFLNWFYQNYDTFIYTRMFLQNIGAFVTDISVYMTQTKS